ncbi:MAG: rhodanese-like domain-containing protein [Syntrophobacterales bacterium]|jgi:rhodanese-related sulfurtransferase
MRNNLQKWLLAVGALALVLVLCHREGSATSAADVRKKTAVNEMYTGYKKEFPAVTDITPKEVMELLARQKKVVLVDVRTPGEQRVSMLPGAITQDELLSNLDAYRDHIIIGYCTISYRSGKLAQDLRKKGITMLNLKGGLLAWVHEGGKVYSQGGETQKVHVYGPKWDLAPAPYQTIRGKGGAD